MIVRPPAMEYLGTKVRVSASVETDATDPGIPDRLWYEFPSAYERFITTNADGFAVAMLPLAMRLGERLVVQGVLSPGLAEGISKYQRILAGWFPRVLKDVPVTACSGPAETITPHAAGAAFSGGVDSLHTMLRHRPDNQIQEGPVVKYAIYVHGFDVPLSDYHTYDETAALYRPALALHGVTLLPVRTNAREMTGNVNWEIAHGAALISVPLMLGGLLSLFYVPSSATYDDMTPWGSDPRIDHLLSTQTTTIVHDGAEFTRVEKIAAIRDWPETHSILRVCWERPSAAGNCCRCYKCITTMIALELCAALPSYTSFPLPLTRHAVRHIHVPTDEHAALAQLMAAAERAGRDDLRSDLTAALRTSNRNDQRKFLRRLTSRISVKVKRLFQGASLC